MKRGSHSKTGGPLKKKPNKNYDPKISLSLIRAAQNGYLKKAKELINSYGLSYAPEWSEGYTLLVEALKKSHRKVAKLIITSGCRVNKENEKPNETPLHFAVIRNYPEIIEMLLNKGAIIVADNNFGTTQLHLAAKGGCLQIVEHLLNRGDNINSVITNDCKKGYTPLHLAIEGGNQKVSSLLINKGADINFKAKDGTTPLHIACMINCEFIAKELIKHGAYVDPLTDTKQTPLHISLRYSGNYQLVELLVHHGANVNIQDIHGKTILHIAVDTNELYIIEKILEYRPDITIESSKGYLNAAVLSNLPHRKIIADVLLEYGLTLKTEDVNNPNLWFTVLKNGFLKVIEYLLKRGIDVNTFPKNKKATPLHIAVKSKNEKVAKLLINYGANVNAQDKHGLTPIFYAIYNKDKNITNPLLLIAAKSENEKLAKLLINYGANVNACYGRYFAVLEENEKIK